MQFPLNFINLGMETSLQFLAILLNLGSDTSLQFPLNFIEI
jgi:hypothetical protein